MAYQANPPPVACASQVDTNWCPSSSLFISWEFSKDDSVLGPLHQNGRLGRDFLLLVSDLLSPSHCSHFESEPTDQRSLYICKICLSSEINKSFQKKNLEINQYGYQIINTRIPSTPTGISRCRLRR